MAKLLGDVAISKKSFTGLEKALKSFEKKEFIALVDRKRSELVNRTLLELIQNEPEPCFLLAAVLEYVERIDQTNILQHYEFNSFESWLNLFSGLGFEENYRVRAKIAGKFVDRNDYSAFFPVGLGKVYEGSHFVTAHKSPDLDTTVASFWGWLDAFAARVSEGMHVWNVPGGPPPSQIEIDWIFRDLFGPAVFTHLVKTRTALHITGSDLMKQEGMQVKQLGEQINSIDHNRDEFAVVLVDELGYYLGDWRSMDVESVREVIYLLSVCLRWFENHLNLNLLELFGKENLGLGDVTPALNRLYELKIGECEPALEFDQKQRVKASAFLTRVLKISKGLDCTFDELGTYFGDFQSAERILTAIKEAKLFDSAGVLVENRSHIFLFLRKAVNTLHEGVIFIRNRLERLDIALKIKTEVLSHKATSVSVRADVDELKAKMGSYPYLTVNYPDNDKLYPVGIVLSSDLRKNTLGTVSLRDFCNREEMGIPSYLEVISVIDHHKSTLSTVNPPFAIISDAQSCNSLVARQSFIINDRNSLGGQSIAGIEKQWLEETAKGTAQQSRIIQRLLSRRMVQKGSFYVHPDREFIEYLHFLYAIIEDTDLLTKVTSVDVECVVSLLNRMKSIETGRECEIVNLDGIPRDKTFAKKSAARILQNEDMYSLYRKVYAFREKEIASNMELASSGMPSNFFCDTKEQNGCCRIGQTKVFEKNISLFEKKGDAIRAVWLETAEKVNKDKPDIALHIHMISTIVSGEEVYKGTPAKYGHKDELWIWIPANEDAEELLKAFLGAFQSSPGLKSTPMEVEFLGPRAKDFENIFRESFVSIPMKQTKSNLSMAILRYNPGSLNSRKSMVSPFLPS